MRRRRIEQRNRRLSRIDGEVAVSQQRGRSRNAKSRSQLAALEEMARQPGGAPGLVLAHQSVTIERVAREIERVACGDVRHLKLAQPRRNCVDRKPGAPPRALRVPLADFSRQL